MRLLVIISLTLLLSSCLGFGKSCNSKAQAGPVSLCLNKEWEQVPDDDLRQNGVPEETLAILQTAEPRAGQRDNIVVTREALPVPAKAYSYALANIKTVEPTAEYDLIEKRDVEADGDKTILHIFTARPVPDLPARRFYQLSLTKGANGFVITGTLPFTVEEDIENDLIEMIMSSDIE